MDLIKRHLGKQNKAKEKAECKISPSAKATLLRVESESNEADLPRVLDPTVQVTRAMSRQ